MKGKRVLKRISACAVACASFTLVACEQGLPSGGSTGSGNGKFDMDEITLDAVYALLESYGVIEDIEDLETLFDEDNAKGYEYLIVEEKGIILVKDNGKKTTYGELGECKHSKFGIPKEEVEGDCETLGVETSVCKNCSAVRYEFDIPSGHEWELIEEIPATKTERGKKIYECEECREGKTEYTPKLEGGNGGLEDDPTKVIIEISIRDSEIGDSWLQEACERFEELKKDEEYLPGTKGVDLHVNPDTINNVYDSLATSENQIFFGYDVAMQDLIASGEVLDISDVVVSPLTDYGEDVSIEEKTEVARRITCKGNDGKYYALPDYEYYGGLTYDVELFEEKNLFFASEGGEGNIFDCKFGTATFVVDENTQRSCGADGMYGTEDDGLPSSIQELLILCDVMNDRYAITPFTMAGAYLNYINHLYSGLWASLAGYEKMQTLYTFNGEVEVVTGFVNEPLFEGADYVNTPVTETVCITPENGYLVYDMAERYYALAFLEIAVKEGWFSENAMTASTNHIDAQAGFVLNGLGNNEKTGMLIEGNYWFNEAETEGIFDHYEKIYPEERRVAWMSLPVTLTGTVEEGCGQETTLVDLSNSYVFVNASVEEDEALVTAIKDFLRFLYTEEELARFTVNTGVLKAVDYEITAEQFAQMSQAKRSVYMARNNARVLYAGADNPIFLHNINELRLSLGSRVLYADELNTNIFTALLHRGKTASEIFAGVQYTANDWMKRFGSYLN